ncbi:MAG: AAA family ATPase [bacterium]
MFDSVDAGASIALARLTLIYAENGRGKTTLAAILRSLATGDPIPIGERHRLAAQHPPHVVLDCNGGEAVFQNNAWSRRLPEMAVFDDVFVDQNVYSGLAVTSQHRQKFHDLILGAQGVALNVRLQELVDRIEGHNRALRTKAEAIPASERGGMNVDDFCALQANPDIDEAIRAAERNLAAAREQQPIRNASVFDPVCLPAFDVDGINALLQQDLANLDAAAAERVQRHLATLGHGGEEWLADGFRRVQARPAVAEAQTCPFCAQSLTGSPVITHYRAYFGEAYADLKRTVADTLAGVNRQHNGDVPAGFERAVRVCGERRQFWSTFCDVPEVAIDTAEIAGTWRAAREAVVTVLHAKQAAPLERMSLSDDARAANAAFETHRQAVAALNQWLQQANVAIRLVKEQVAAGNPTVLAADVARLKAVKARHTPATTAMCRDYLNEKAAKATTERQREEAKHALRRHRRTIFPAHESAINEYLQRFNAGFRLGSVAAADTRGGPTCTYNILINNTPVPVAGGTASPGEPSFRTTLSSGDRNALALAFFFASLDQDPELPNRIVIIDDPITSLDDHRSLVTVQEVRALATRAQQVIVLSHDKRFLCRVWENANRRACAALAVVRDTNGSTIEEWNVNDDCLTEYDRQHARLREYARTNTGNARQVAQDIRHVLEGFLRRACPEHFLPGEVLGDFRRRIRNRQETGPEILSASAVSELDAITEYANRFHHDTNSAWETEVINDTELRGWVTRALDFVRKNDTSARPLDPRPREFEL